MTHLPRPSGPQIESALRATRRILQKLPKRVNTLILLAAQQLTYPPDFSQRELALCESVAPFTMTSPERIVALADAVRHLAMAQIPGDIVECGVWRGGSMMVIAQTLLEVGDVGRDLYLFDTFEGMSAPTDADVAVTSESASSVLARASKADGRSMWCVAGEEDVRANLRRTAYPSERVRLVRGKVEDTLPDQAPEKIALLRLDTDWYESTRHELVHLYPRLASGGILIIDDYGHWLGARKATDEYLASLPVKPLLCRVDYSGRIALKP